MVITVTCPSCSSAFPVDPAKIPEGGVNARCTQCGDIFRVDKPSDPEPAPTFEDLTPVAEPTPPEPTPAEPEPTPAVAETPDPGPPTETESPAADFGERAPTDDWVIETEEAPGQATTGESGGERTEPSGVEADLSSGLSGDDDPFAASAPFEEPGPDMGGIELTPEMAEPLPAPEPPVEEEPAAQEPEPPADAPAAAPVQGFTFGKRDPTDKAKRLARVLVSDMIMYNAERHQSALAEGTLVADFEEEIEKSWKEFVEQVGEEIANNEGRQFWTDALNDILAKGDKVF